MNLKKILAWTAVILWMTLIFYLSHQPATVSGQLSTGISEVLIKAMERIVPYVGLDIKVFEHMLRKSVHFIAYLVLGVLTFNALRRSGVYGYKGAFLALGICVLYAISDEVHQLFIPGRSGEVMDVLIDIAGASVGIILYILVGKLMPRLLYKS